MTGRSCFASACTFTVALAPLAALWCNSPAAAQAVDQLDALAKEEKALVLWAAGPTGHYETAVRAFEQQFPGIAVSLTGGFSNVLNARIEQQLRASKIETDVAILQTIQDFIRWNSRGRLLHFKPEGFDKIGVRSKDGEGAWIAVNTNPIFYGYNTEHVRDKNVPRLATDFLRMQHQGKLITAYPADDDATLFAFATIVQKYGWGYMAQYMKLSPDSSRGISASPAASAPAKAT